MRSWPEHSLPSKIARAAEWLKDGHWPPDVRASQIDRAEAAELRTALQNKLNPATPHQIVGALLALAVNFYRPDFSEAQAKIIVNQQLDDFADVPADILAEACTTWRRTEKWFPKPSELLALTGPMLRKRRDALADVSRVMDRIEGRSRSGDNFQPLTGEQEGSMAALIARLKASQPEPPEAA
jgi:hypothetical protein